MEYRVSKNRMIDSSAKGMSNRRLTDLNANRRESVGPDDKTSNVETRLKVDKYDPHFLLNHLKLFFASSG